MSKVKNRVLRFLGIVLAAILVLGVVALIVMSGIAPRLKAAAELRNETQEAAVPVVAVIPPKRGTPTQEIVLPATIRAFTDAPIYARTNGYLKRWYADIGVHVSAGQLLAEIETPEVDRQVEQAKADLANAQANYKLAETTLSRYQDLLKSDSVTKQEVDNFAGNFEARKAAVQSSQSNLDRLQQLQSFEKVYAPFDGVVTARNTDIGALIDSGGSNPAKELFHVASTERVRIYVDVPQNYSRLAKPGLTADLSLAEYPGRRFKATFVDTSHAIAEASRTLRVEFDATNKTGELLPGAYAEVHLQLPASTTTYVVPVTALLFRSEGLRIAIIKEDNHAVLLPVTLGRDFGGEVEVVSGLAGDERVVISPPDSIVTGETVRIAKPSGDKK